MRSDSEDFSDQENEPFMCPTVLFGVANPLFDGASSSNTQQHSPSTKTPPSTRSDPPQVPCDQIQQPIGPNSAGPVPAPQPMPSSTAEATADAHVLPLQGAAVSRLIQQVEDQIEAQNIILDRNVLTFKLQAWKQQLAQYPYWAAQEASMREVLHHAGLIVSKQFVAEAYELLRCLGHQIMDDVTSLDVPAVQQHLTEVVCWPDSSDTPEKTLHAMLSNIGCSVGEEDKELEKKLGYSVSHLRSSNNACLARKLRLVLQLLGPDSAAQRAAAPPDVHPHLDKLLSILDAVQHNSLQHSQATTASPAKAAFRQGMNE